MKNRIKVTQNFVDKANRYKKKHLLMKYLCTKHLYREREDSFRLVIKIWLPIYLILLIPVMLIKTFYCIWDGGLKSLDFESRVVMNREIYRGIYPDDFSTCENEWNKRMI